ncbi:MAG: 4-hydroxybenzoate polyprenyltransferase [Gammaproteobacteria bacterium RIFCSPHIGHO2_12_FULL_37_34]|nr:MAG: 4-hydroxybenzoate polyprenyltransferase [Gammaproteobacteria bacterium RIFCSPHIGHO2_12_FULL_37_34]
MLIHRLKQYALLMRLNKPIGIALLLWPTLWALWLASHGQPHVTILLIFIAGVVLMRSAGCVVNDVTDRYIDGHVQRTLKRPLVTGTVTLLEAWFIAALLGMAAFFLVLLCNPLTIQLAFIGAGLTLIYPFMKRFTHLPQLGLGVAFAWGILMAFAAETASIPFSAWMVFAAGVIWPIIYDTMYAMADKADDIKIGVKSTAILFGHRDIQMIVGLQIIFILLLVIIGGIFHLTSIYYISLIFVGAFFIYQQRLIRHRDPKQCFRAFLNNHWVGMIIFMGIYL